MERKERIAKKKKFLWSSFLFKRKVVCNLCNLWFKDEKAQSITLGFVIIMGIVLSASIILLSMEIPEQTRKFEFEHSSKVPLDFAELGSIIDLTSLRGKEDPTASCSQAVGMAPESVPLVGIHASGGSLSFDSSSEKFECIACSPDEVEEHDNSTRWWNSMRANFSSYDKFHVDVLEEGAKLQLAGEDREYNSSGEVHLSGEFWFVNFSVINGTILYTHWLTIHAKNITIGPNSSIVADGSGLAGGKWEENGTGQGGGHIIPIEKNGDGLSGNFSVGGGGAGYNGSGGQGGNARCRGKADTGTSGYPFTYHGDGPWGDGGRGGDPYGNATEIAADFGSGGAGGARGRLVFIVNDSIPGGKGGNSGGIIFLDAPSITIAGNLSANGEDGRPGADGWDSTGGGGGGGSGGTILLKGGNISIGGNLSAKGGSGGAGGRICDNDTQDNNNGGGGGGGSGGRIKVFYGPAPYYAHGSLANHANVSCGLGGAGDVGWWLPGDSNCTSPDNPYNGGDGSPGGNGTIHNASIDYIESIPHYPTGWLISTVNDVGQAKDTSTICYGNITWNETIDSGTSIVMKVRTSMNASMSGVMPWEDCPSAANGVNISDLPSVSDGHRYIQWRAELYTFERSKSPELHSVNISYSYGLPVITSCKGSIVFKSQYLYLPNYKLVYAHGATIKNQTSGEFMLFPPPISISNDNTNGNISLAISSVNLTGSTPPVSGGFSSTVKASFRKSDLLTGGLNFHNITLNVTTEYPTAWRKWFNETCGNRSEKGAGLEYGTDPGNYYINETGNTLQITFYGNESRPVNLWLKRAEVEIEIEK